MMMKESLKNGRKLKPLVDIVIHHMYNIEYGNLIVEVMRIISINAQNVSACGGLMELIRSRGMM